MTAAVSAALQAAVARLAAAGVPRPRDEALRIVALALGTDRGGVLARSPDPLTPEAEARLWSLLARRARREPFQYLTGEQEFRGLPIAVDARVLIPRPETEEVVETALSVPLDPGGVVADLGTGSGCIAIAIAVARPDLRVLALDLSEEALGLARENARRNGAEVAFAHGDFGSPPDAWAGRVDLVVSNPPYVSEAEWAELPPEVREHEPRAALVPGKTGLEAYRALLPAARGLLVPGGSIVLELGWQSAAAVQALAADLGFSAIHVQDDARGVPRVLLARA